MCTGGTWAHSLRSESSRYKPGEASPGAQPAQPLWRGGGPQGAATEIGLRVRRIASAGSLALIQITCGHTATTNSMSPAAKECLGTGATGSCHVNGAGGAFAMSADSGGGQAVCGQHAVELLQEVARVLREECVEGGVGGGVLWNVRVFAVSEIASHVRVALQEIVGDAGLEAGSGGQEADLGGLGGCADESGLGDVGTAASGAPAGSLSAGQGWCSGATVTEVSGLHDADVSVMWAIRALVVCI